MVLFIPLQAFLTIIQTAQPTGIIDLHRKKDAFVVIRCAYWNDPNFPGSSCFPMACPLFTAWGQKRLPSADLMNHTGAGIPPWDTWINAFYPLLRLKRTTQGKNKLVHVIKYVLCVVIEVTRIERCFIFFLPSRGEWPSFEVKQECCSAFHSARKAHHALLLCLLSARQMSMNFFCDNCVKHYLPVMTKH